MSLGLRGLVVRVARAVNKALRRKGPVWGDRYHARDLRSPSETRTALLYVLQNWKKHIRGARGIVYFPGGRRSIGEMVESLRLIHAVYTAEEMVGRLEYL